MNISLDEICSFLKTRNNFYILTHQYPDGDTLGSANALCRALQKTGKNARVLCSDKIPKKYSILSRGIKKQEFEADYIISVDVADTQLLGENLLKYSDKIDLCIDHHESNKAFAKMQYIEGSSAATAEIIYELINLLGVKIDKQIAVCIYTGITTDTGGFKYANATPRSYRISADMLEKGIDACSINRIMFDTKSRSRLEIERQVLDTMEFFYESRCAVIHVTREMIKKAKANESDIEGLASIPRQVEGVLVGVTLREQKDGVFKVSVRTEEDISAAAICENFGGGGHQGAAGCNLPYDLDVAKKKIVDAVGFAFKGK
ncbi:MAG: Bifunctional oligoribonuclease and PAP phosphatase NrnA [Eubacteriales bacterium SKADARSKE-1]|nr:Bifunctional oligoribonuclease and PAP phosphatase NrnA [Eubacteriales bacterium SKADARSKE-1]